MSRSDLDDVSIRRQSSTLTDSHSKRFVIFVKIDNWVVLRRASFCGGTAWPAADQSVGVGAIAKHPHAQRVDIAFLAQKVFRRDEHAVLPVHGLQIDIFISHRYRNPFSCASVDACPDAY